MATTAKLTDYSNSEYIPVTDSYAIIWQTSEYLRHRTNLTMYVKMADGTEKLRTHFPQSHVKKILDSDIGHIRKLLDTALKIVAGKPDFDDFENVNNKSSLIRKRNRFS